MPTWSTRRSSSRSLGQAVGHDALAGSEHDHPVPLAALHAVDGAKGDAALGVHPVEGGPQPGSKDPASGWRSATWSRASRSSRCEPAAPAAAVEQGHGRAEADAVAHRAEQVPGRGAALGQPGEAVEVAGQVVELGRHLDVVDPARGLAHVGDGPAAVEDHLVTHLGRPRLGRRWTSARSRPSTRVRVDGDAQVGQRGPHARVRDSTPASRIESTGRPASPSATCGARRSDCTRASTATWGGRTPGSASQPCTSSTSAAAPASRRVGCAPRGRSGSRSTSGPAGSPWPPAGRCSRAGWRPPR